MYGEHDLMTVYRGIHIHTFWRSIYITIGWGDLGETMSFKYVYPRSHFESLSLYPNLFTVN